LSCHTSRFEFFKLSIGTHASPPVLLDVGDEVQNDMPTAQEEMPHP